MPTDIITTTDARAEQASSLLDLLGLHFPPHIENMIIAGIILVGFILLAIVASLIISMLRRRYLAKDSEGLLGNLLFLLRSPFLSWIVISGVTSALIYLKYFTGIRSLILRIYGAVSVILLVIIASRIMSLLISWWFRRREQQEGGYNDHYSAMTSKIITALIWVVGSMLVLAQLGVKITPLLTTLGLGSLAVALALQDTLANFFAGIYLMLDRPIRVGDYVRLDTKDEGFVDAIGWRSTHIRLWSNYVVVIPNSRLTSSVITNMVLNKSETGVYIYGGVGYLNDLDRVEEVLIEVGREVLLRVNGAVSDAEPTIRFQEFGDSNIKFLAILKAEDFAFQYVIKHEFIKAVHKRFRNENIEIAWPVRQLVTSEPLPVRVMNMDDSPEK